MTKIKTRFKRALYGFFKEEILNSIGYSEPVKKIEFISKEMQIKELKAEFVLDDNSLMSQPFSYVWSRQLEKVKKDLFDECMNHIKIDSYSITDPRVSREKIIKVSLFIGTS